MTKIVSELLTRKEAAQYLRLKPNTLAVWLSTKRVNIPCVKIGGRVMYRKQDLDKFIESSIVG